MARTYILRAFSLQMSCCLSLLVLPLFCFCFVFVFIEATALRSTVLRCVCTPTATRSHLTTVWVFFVFVYFFLFFLFLWRCRFFRVFLYRCRFLCMESTLYVLLPNGVFLSCDHGMDFGISLLCDKSTNEIFIYITGEDTSLHKRVPAIRARNRKM